jgi:uncharacterized protein with GYD domain
MKASGERSDAIYWVPTGEYSGVEIVELPDAATAGSIAALAHSTGAFTEYRLIQLLTTSEIDGALGKPIVYRPPGG